MTWQDVIDIILFRKDLKTKIELLTVERDNLAQKLVTANDLIYNLSKSDDGKAAKIVEMNQSILSLTSQLDTANKSIENMRVELALYAEIQPPTPSFLNVANVPYKPARQFVQPNGDVQTIYVEDPRDMFVFFSFEKDFVTNNNLRKLSKHDKLMKIWEYVVNKNTKQYVYDYSDNWQFALDTYYRHSGDCEDSSILFVTLARVLGIPSTDVFLIVGPTNFGYHAYPAVFYRDDEAKIFGGTSGWYIFESTLDYLPSKPVAINGSGYWVDGAMNWKFYGTIQPQFIKDFNGGTQAPGAIDKKQKLENSIKKNERIKRVWQLLGDKHNK